MKKTLGVFLKAILAGFCIGLGGVVFLGLMPTNKPLGAFLFAIGLFTICTHGFNLFTGKACYILENKPSYLGTLVVIWIGNLIGAGHRERVREAVHTSVLLALVAGIFLLGLGIILTPFILRLMSRAMTSFRLSIWARRHIRKLSAAASRRLRRWIPS